MYSKLYVLPLQYNAAVTTGGVIFLCRRTVLLCWQEANASPAISLKCSSIKNVAKAADILLLLEHM